MFQVLVNFLDVESAEEMRSAQEVIGDAGTISLADQIRVLRSVFMADRQLWRRETFVLGQVPAKGEFICIPLEEDVWYAVAIVLHTPGNPSHVAEIWALEETENSAS